MHANEFGLYLIRWRWGVTRVYSFDKHLLSARNTRHTHTGTRCTAREGRSQLSVPATGTLTVRSTWTHLSFLESFMFLHSF